MDSKELFIEWERLVKSLKDFHSETSDSFHNAPYALQKCKDLLKFMKKETPSIREWCTNYLEENRHELYVKYWLEHGWNHLNQHNGGTGNLRFPPRSSDIHPEFQDNWERIHVYMGVREESNFTTAVNLFMEAHKIHNPSNCHIEEINKYHEGKACDFNGYYCWYCEDVEDRWHYYLKKNLQAANNVFLNKDVKEKFLKKATEAKLALDTWKPPITNSHIRSINLETNGKTATQIMHKIVEFASWQIQIWNLRTKSDYEKFNELWLFLESLDSKLCVLEDALQKVEEIVNPP